MEVMGGVGWVRKCPYKLSLCPTAARAFFFLLIIMITIVTRPPKMDWNGLDVFRMSSLTACWYGGISLHNGKVAGYGTVLFSTALHGTMLHGTACVTLCCAVLWCVHSGLHNTLLYNTLLHACYGRMMLMRQMHRIPFPWHPIWSAGQCCIIALAVGCQTL